MMKAAETIWVDDQNAQLKNRAASVAIYLVMAKWFHVARQTLRHLFLMDCLQGFFRNVSQRVIPHKRNVGIWRSFLLYQQQKSEVTKQSIKEEFFYASRRIGSKNIPHRTWKRHSGFLVYRQKMNSLQRELTRKTDRQLEMLSSELLAAQTRISFQVESIKQLPIWASALNDISLFENDMSALRFVEVRTRINIITRAA